MRTETIQIHGVPAQGVQIQRARAQAQNVSLSQYVRELIRPSVSGPTTAEVL